MKVLKSGQFSISITASFSVAVYVLAVLPSCYANKFA